jgi:hypothetical protein
MKNIEIKAGTRIGSRKWFAEKEWTVSRITYNGDYPDVVEFKADDGSIYLEPQGNGNFLVEMRLTEFPRISDALADDLVAFVDKFEKILTTDDNVDPFEKSRREGYIAACDDALNCIDQVKKGE